MRMSVPSTTSRFRVEASASWGSTTAGRRLANALSEERRRRRPFSGRCALGRVSHLYLPGGGQQQHRGSQEGTWAASWDPIWYLRLPATTDKAAAPRIAGGSAGWSCSSTALAPQRGRRPQPPPTPQPPAPRTRRCRPAARRPRPCRPPPWMRGTGRRWRQWRRRRWGPRCMQTPRPRPGQPRSAPAGWQL